MTFDFTDAEVRALKFSIEQEATRIRDEVHDMEQIDGTPFAVETAEDWRRRLPAFESAYRKLQVAS